MKRHIIAVIALIGALLPVGASQAQTGTQIRFLNPSPYSDTHKPEVTSGRPVHLVAWVSQVPTNPFVEFEFQSVDDGPLGGGAAQTIDATRVGTDTWEASFAIPASFLEGDYELRARVYASSEEVAATKQTVVVDQAAAPPVSESVTLEHPTNGGPAGFYGTAGRRPNTLMEIDASVGTDQVRVLYTKSAPGTQPVWNSCGDGVPGSTTNLAIARCTLKEGDLSSQVTALAAVANNTPSPGDPAPAADDASDAARVSVYLQVPSSVQFDQDGYEVAEGECNDFRFVVEDQTGRPIAGANVDLHAEGPSDQLRFATNDSENPIIPSNDDYQAPDKVHTSSERAVRCSDERNAPESQGDHNVIGGSDRKHIESVDGTNNDGSFTFTLFSGTKGGTVATAWVDGDDDDNQSTTEASGFGRIGWGQDPPPPPRQVVVDPDTSSAEPDTCVRTVLQAKQGGSPLSGVNVDVHIKGPGADTSFCPPIDASTSRGPDQGGHVDGNHEDGTKHLEGETDGSGNFIFGVSSGSSGDMDIGGWIDDSDDDAFAPAEPGNSSSIFWTGGAPQRVSSSSTIRYANGTFKGRVRSAKPGCRRGRVVTVKRKKRGADTVIGSNKTNRRGVWKVRHPRAKGRYYAVVKRKRFASGDQTVVCKQGRSRAKRAG